MGLFGGKKISINIPAAPKLPTAEELFQSALSLGRREFPLALGAREGALSDIALGPEFYSRFQPTSLEDAIASQYFQNVVPDLERSIKHSLSLSGIESSPILAEQIAKARGRVGVDIGQYLANLGNQRAQFSLQSRLGIDPYAQILNPFVSTGVAQSQKQAELQSQHDMARAIADYQNAVAAAQRKAGIGKLIGGIGGAIVGLPFGNPFLGASLGSSLGGTIAGGGGEPILGIQDAFSIGGGGFKNPFAGGGGGGNVGGNIGALLSAQPVYSTPSFGGGYTPLQLPRFSF